MIGYIYTDIVCFGGVEATFGSLLLLYPRRKFPYPYSFAFCIVWRLLLLFITDTRIAAVGAIAKRSALTPLRELVLLDGFLSLRRAIPLVGLDYCWRAAMAYASANTRGAQATLLPSLPWRGA